MSERVTAAATAGSMNATGEAVSTAASAPSADSANGHCANAATARAVLSIDAAGERLADLAARINRLQRSLRLAIETELADWSAQSFGSLEDNRKVAKLIADLVDRHGLRLRCAECGHPAILRCSPRPGVPDGAFVFDHSIDGRRTFHGGTSSLPQLRLVTKPPRRTAQTATDGLPTKTR